MALASGKAFSFGYAEHARVVAAAGAEVAEFDPFSDTLPDGANALVLPGGFPEQFTAELSANDIVRRQIAELAAAGRPCTPNARPDVPRRRPRRTPMCGVLSGSARFTEQLKLGYRDAVAVADSTLHLAGHG